MSGTTEKFLSDTEATSYQITATVTRGVGGFSTTFSIVEDEGCTYENDLESVDIVECTLE